MKGAIIFSRRLSLSLAGALLGLALVCHGQIPRVSAVNVTLVTDEAQAVLDILAKRREHQPVIQGDWDRLFATEGYVRLKKRETSLKRPFDDEDFKAFVLSRQLADRSPALEETLGRWKRADISRAAGLALAYLPEGARISAKIYPVIKPKENSFVFDLKSDPAIFLYLDPGISREKFENTLAHELHHIGYSGSCPSQQTAVEIATMPIRARTVAQLVGGFGEGFAMLAAAGGPDIHPHAVSTPEERARWDRDMANFNTDLKTVDKFFLDILQTGLSDEQIENTAMSFFGVQGPWYTVGWRMSVLIEKTFGRDMLIKCMCDTRQLLPAYNKAAIKHSRGSQDKLALWSPRVIGAIK